MHDCILELQEGPDGVGYRPDTVEIRRRHPAKSFSSSFSISSFIRDIAEGVVGQPEVSLELFKSEEPIFVSHSLCPYTCVAVYFANIGRQALLGQENSKKNRNYLTPQTPRNFPMDLTQQNENHVM